MDGVDKFQEESGLSGEKRTLSQMALDNPIGQKELGEHLLPSDFATSTSTHQGKKRFILN